MLNNHEGFVGIACKSCAKFPLLQDIRLGHQNASVEGSTCGQSVFKLLATLHACGQTAAVVIAHSAVVCYALPWLHLRWLQPELFACRLTAEADHQWQSAEGACS